MSSFKQCATWWPISKVLSEAGALEKVKALGAPASRELLEIGEQEGITFVVTPDWQRAEPFDYWVTRYNQRLS